MKKSQQNFTEIEKVLDLYQKRITILIVQNHHYIPPFLRFFYSFYQHKYSTMQIIVMKIEMKIEMKMKSK